MRLPVRIVMLTVHSYCILRLLSIPIPLLLVRWVIEKTKCIDETTVKNFSIPDAHQKFYCGQNVLLAHSKAYHLGKKMIPDSVIAYKNGTSQRTDCL